MRTNSALFLLSPVFYNESMSKILFIAVLFAFLFGTGAWYYYERTSALAPAGETGETLDNSLNQNKGMPVIGGADI